MTSVKKGNYIKRKKLKIGTLLFIFWGMVVGFLIIGYYMIMFFYNSTQTMGSFVNDMWP